MKKIEFLETGLIATPQSAIRDTGEAEIIAIGPYVTEVEIGECVLLRKYAASGTEVRHEGAPMFWYQSMNF